MAHDTASRLHSLGVALRAGFPTEDLAENAAAASELVLAARDEITELHACIRKLCPEIEARKLLSFATAESIFSAPRRDN